MNSLFSIKFEVHHFLDSKEAFLRRAVAQSLSRPIVQPSGHSIAVGLCDVCLAGSLWKVLPQQPIEVLVATSLP